MDPESIALEQIQNCATELAPNSVKCKATDLAAHFTDDIMSPKELCR